MTNTRMRRTGGWVAAAAGCLRYGARGWRGGLITVAGLGLAAAWLGIAASGCSSSTASSTSPGGSSPSASPSAKSGTVSLASAGSLLYLNQTLFGPAFTKAAGYPFVNHSAGSDALSAEIASGVLSPNVFQSVGGDPIVSLEPKFTSWYIRYAATSMVLAYNPSSKYASQFAAIGSGKKPLSDLFTLLQQPGLKLGRTDPNTDPQGRYFIFMLELAQQRYHLPAGTVNKIIGVPAGASNLAKPSSQIFDETALDSRLQAGQLDAASAYLSQAIQLHLHYITLPATINLGEYQLKPVYAKASITITGGVKKTGKPIVMCVSTIGNKDTAAADAFVQYLLSPAGRQVYQQAGFTLLTPTAFGKTSAIPAAIASELG